MQLYMRGGNVMEGGTVPISNAERCRRAYQKNRQQRLQKFKEYYAQNPRAQLVRNRKAKYGVTEEQVEKLFAEQGNVCAVCKTDKPGGRGSWHLDHDHVTKRVRGLLCINCNALLGHAKDCLDNLRAAIKYLEKI
jgi:hypothetical protein